MKDSHGYITLSVETSPQNQNDPEIGYDTSDTEQTLVKRAHQAF